MSKIMMYRIIGNIGATMGVVGLYFWLSIIGIGFGLCERSSKFRPLLSEWKQQARFQLFKWTFQIVTVLELLLIVISMIMILVIIVDDNPLQFHYYLLLSVDLGLCLVQGILLIVAKFKYHCSYHAVLPPFF